MFSVWGQLKLQPLSQGTLVPVTHVNTEEYVPHILMLSSVGVQKSTMGSDVRHLTLIKVKR